MYHAILQSGYHTDWSQHREMCGGFLLSGDVFMWKLPIVGARRWKGDSEALFLRGQ
jgi:hypothetical protein